MEKELLESISKLKLIYGSSIRVERITNAVIIYFRGYPIDTFHIKEFKRNKLRFVHWLKTINSILKNGIEHTLTDKIFWSNFWKIRPRGEEIK